MARQFTACKEKVSNRGRPPDAFLDDLVDWGISAPAHVFAKNDKFDIYSSIVQELCPWQSDLHRRAVMLEALRVLGGFESSWNWDEGVDITNPTSNTPCTEEAGIFQCSGNSMDIDPSLKTLLVATGADGSCDSFITTTKADHVFAIGYCARLIRFTTKHHGPIKGKFINPWLRRDAVAEFQAFLA